MKRKMTVKTVVWIKGRGVEVDVEAIARHYLSVCQKPDCNGDLYDIGHEKNLPSCPRCGELKETGDVVINKACHEITIYH